MSRRKYVRVFVYERKDTMPKPKRGKNARLTKGWRGSCPSCSRTGVKILWEKKDGDNTLKVCKRCAA